VLVGLLTHGYVRRGSSAGERQPLTEGVLRLSVDGIDLGAKDKTLILALNVNCTFCTQSLPFYKRLLKSGERGGYKTQIVAVFPNEQAEVFDYVVRHRLEVQSLHEVDFARLGVGGTPTLLLVDRNGTVIDSWVGQLAEQKEAEVLRAVNAE
jgi:thioredoxin-related protein